MGRVPEKRDSSYPRGNPMKRPMLSQSFAPLAKLTLKAIALGGVALSLTVVGHMASTDSQSAIALRINTENPGEFLRRGARGCQGCDLNGADMSNQNRAGVKLRQAQLKNADLSNSNFRVAYFTCANLSGADLRKGNFEYANFVDANLSGVDLRGANLRRVDFSGAIIDENTKFDGADLDGAKLWDAATLYDGTVDLDSIQRSDLGDQIRVRCDNR